MSSFILILIVVLVGLAGFALLRGGSSSGDSSPDGAGPTSSSPDGESTSSSTEPAGNSKASRVYKKLNEVREQKSATKLKAQTRFQIPSAPENLFGRRSVITRIIEKYKEGRRLWGLSGPRGIGKTVVACKTIEYLAPDFPDGQIYFNFQWADHPERAVYEVMAHTVNSLEPEMKTSGTDAETTQAYQAVLKEKKVVLLVDNVPGMNDVSRLVPPDSCLLILTSLERFSIPNMSWEELGPLEKEDMNDLLLECSNRIGFWTSEISKHCQYNPFAAEMCGLLVAENTNLDPAVLAAKIRDSGQEMAKQISDRNQCGLETVWLLLFALLNEKIRGALSRILVFPNSFGREAESFICEDQESILMEVLMRLGFVNFNDVTERYFIPPTLREWLLKKIDIKAQSFSRTRQATYYMTQLQKAHELFHSNQPMVKAQALCFFDLEWGNIRSSQAWAQDNCMKDQDSARVCYGYVEYGYDLLRYRQPPTVRLAWLEGAVRAAQTLQDEESELHCMILQGREMIALLQNDRAIEILEKAKTLAEKYNNQVSLLESLHSLGLAHVGQKKNEKALSFFIQEQDVAKKQEAKAIQLRAEEEIVQIYFRGRQFDQAEKCLEAALKTAEAMNDSGATFRLGREKARLLQEMGKSVEAVEVLEKLRQSPQVAADKLLKADLLMALGDTYRAQGEPAKAAPNYEQARAMYRAANQGLLQATAMGWQGLCLLLAGDQEEGTKMIRLARGSLRKAGATDAEMDILFHAGSFHIEAGQLDVAVGLLDQLSQIARKSGKPEWRQKAHLHLGNILEKQGKLADALIHLKTSYRLLVGASSKEAGALKQRIDKIEKSTTAA